MDGSDGAATPVAPTGKGLWQRARRVCSLGFNSLQGAGSKKGKSKFVLNTLKYSYSWTDNLLD